VSPSTRRVATRAAWTLSVLGGLSACATYYVPAGEGRQAGMATVAGGDLSDAGLARYVADMDRSMLALARRHDPRPHKNYWGRVPGWEVIDLADIPRLGDRDPTFEEARIINALRGVAPLPIEPAKPFVLKTSGPERDRALHCLTQAVYFEAAVEPLEGKQAVAQTVLNRMRHPGYPKSICGVVYEGSLRATGCQFSFTCDGSLNRDVNPSLWATAEAVARRALSGFVMQEVGTATHYHADYVSPYWAPTLVKLRQFGAHIFYRWTGPSGAVSAFRGRYAGGELAISPETLMAADPRTLEAAPPAILAQAMAASPTGLLSDAHFVVVKDPTVPGGERVRIEGTVAGRRTPTPAEIAAINKALEAMPVVAADTSVKTPPPPVVAAPPPPPPRPKPRPPSLLNPLN